MTLYTCFIMALIGIFFVFIGCAIFELLSDIAEVFEVSNEEDE